MLKTLIGNVKGSVGIESKTPWEEYIREGLAIKRKIAELEGQDGRLSLAGCLKLLLPWAGTTRERLDLLRDKLKASGVMNEAGLAVWRVIYQVIRPGKFNQPVPTPKNEGAMFRVYGLEAAGAELAREGFSPRELYALAFVLGAERYPESFGTCEDWEGRESKLRQLYDRWRKLEQVAERFWTGSDLIIEEAPPGLKQDGYVKASFKVTGGAVYVGSDNFRRCCEHLLKGGGFDGD